MKKLMFLTILFSLIISCEKNMLRFESDYVARIAGFDPNCSVCILEFPDETAQVQKEIGSSPDNYYLAANLTKGDYEIGQRIKVRIRKAKNEELTSCNSQNSNGYEKVVITNLEKFNDLVFNDTVSLSYRDCLYEPVNQFYVCLDSVFNDSRCPNGAYCFWEGNAVVRLKFEKIPDQPEFFDLNTHRQFRTDTTIGGYTISLVGLDPVPSTEVRIPQSDYIAKITVKKKN